MRKMTRCKPGNLVMAEAVPFGQKWTYYNEHPMTDMIKPEYYSFVATQIRTGDSLRIMKMAKGKVGAVTDLLVIAEDQFHIMHGPIIFDKDDGYQIEQKDGKWILYEYEIPLNTYSTKREAEKGLEYFSGTEGKVSNG